MGWLSKLLFGEPLDKAAGRFWLERERSFNQEVVGEGHYQEALHNFCGGYCREGYKLECEVQLLPEPSNKYDANAVRVVLSGRTVGYLPSEDAERFNEQMDSLGRRGQGGWTNGRVVGGWRTNQHDYGNFGIYLALRWPLAPRASS